MEAWNEFCSYLIDCKERNVSEGLYHEIIESQLSVLGWKKFKGEICHKERIPSGHGFAEPDIVIKKDGINQLVVEVKKPNHIQTAEDQSQLLSYMRLCTLRCGIYIGEHIEIFFDVQNNTTKPVSVYKIPLSLNNGHGKQFIDLIKRDSFDENALIKFCESQLIERQKQELIKSLKERVLNGKYTSYLIDCLKHHLQETDYSTLSEKEIDDTLNDIRIDIVSKNAVVQTESVPVTFIHSTVAPQKTNSGRDTTRFSLDGSSFLPKNRFALAVVRKYVINHPTLCYEEIHKTFPDIWQGSSGVIRQVRNIAPRQITERRYFVAPGETLCSSDGIKFAVSTQWKIDNIQNLFHFAKIQGWNVKKSE